MRSLWKCVARYRADEAEEEKAAHNAVLRLGELVLHFVLQVRTQHVSNVKEQSNQAEKYIAC